MYVTVNESVFLYVIARNNLFLNIGLQVMQSLAWHKFIPSVSLLL